MSSAQRALPAARVAAPAAQVRVASTTLSLIVSFIVFTALGVAVQRYTHAWTGDVTRALDEASHFVNAVLIRDYVLYAFGSNPLHYALGLYYHIPRIGIGHWPPMLALTEGVVLLFTNLSYSAAMVFQAATAGATAAITGSLAARSVAGRWQSALVSLVAGLAVLCSPEIMELLNAIMADTLVAFFVLLSCIAWAAYARTGQTIWSVAFAIAASAAILTKGNAIGLALLPPFYIILTRRWSLIVNWRTWFAAVLVALLTGPWYALTYKMQANGFIYKWGLHYTSIAVPGFSLLALQTFGIIVLAGFVLGTMVAVKGPPNDTLGSCVAGAIALFITLLIVPAALQGRYLIEIVPLLIVIACYGFAHVARSVRPSVAAVATAALIALNTALVFHLPGVSPPAVLNQATQLILQSPDSSPLVLVGAGSRDEGGLIASFARFDRHMTHYVIRADKALAQSNFLGSEYHARFQTPEQVADWIKQNHIGWIVLDDGPDSQQMLHNKQLAALIHAGQPNWRVIYEGRQPDATVRLVQITDPTPNQADIATVLKQVAPDMD